MVVLILEKVPASLRGELSRWMIEPRTGVFVGVMSALVRDRLWEKVCATCEAEEEKKGSRRKGGAVLIARARTEQGFAVRTHGDPSRELIDAEGVTLVRIPASKVRARPGRTLDADD